MSKNFRKITTWKLQMEAILIKSDHWEYVDGSKVIFTHGKIKIAAWNKTVKKPELTLSSQ